MDLKIRMFLSLMVFGVAAYHVQAAGQCDYPVGACTSINDPCPPGDERCPQYDSDCPSGINHCCCHIKTTTAPPPPCEEGIDFGIIMDGSPSVGSTNFNKCKSFVKDLVGTFQISPQGTRAGIISYSETAQLFVDFADVNLQTPSAMKDIIDKIPYNPSHTTRTDRALELANSALFSSEGGDRTEKPNVLMVITDGMTDPWNSKPYPTVLEPLINQGVETIAVGVGPDINYSELLEIANGKQENVFTVEDFDKLVEVLNDVIEASC